MAGTESMIGQGGVAATTDSSAGSGSKVLRRRKSSTTRSSSSGGGGGGGGGVRSPTRSVYAEPREIKEGDPDFPHIFIALGATGDQAKRRTYPVLWNLYKAQLLPRNTYFYGFGRTKMTVDELKEKCRDYMRVGRGEESRFDDFWRANRYHMGSYTSRMDFELLSKELSRQEVEAGAPGSSNRLFYVALPHNLMESAITNLATITIASISGQRKAGWTRIVVERPPVGKDSEQTDQKVNRQLASLFREEDVYRIDHYLGKETVRNLTAVRFGNLIFSSTWNRGSVASVLIAVKEYGGVQGKEGKQFDGMGVVREAVRNHLLQILTLVAMEKPVNADADNVRDEKVKVLRAVAPVEMSDVVLGQYRGYRDEPEVARNSNTATYCSAVVRIRNERWDGVPFLLTCGKGLEETAAEVRVQYRDVPGEIFDEDEDEEEYGGSRKVREETTHRRNELIIRLEPGESVHLRAFLKSPDAGNRLQEVNLALADKVKKEDDADDDNNNNNGKGLLGPYERLVWDVFNGAQTHFVRTDELEQSWRIFEPLLKRIDEGKVTPHQYDMGSAGPKEAAQLIAQNNFRGHATERKQRT